MYGWISRECKGEVHSANKIQAIFNSYCIVRSANNCWFVPSEHNARRNATNIPSLQNCTGFLVACVNNEYQALVISPPLPSRETENEANCAVKPLLSTFTHWSINWGSSEKYRKVVGFHFLPQKLILCKRCWILRSWRMEFIGPIAVWLPGPIRLSEGP